MKRSASTTSSGEQSIDSGGQVGAMVVRTAQCDVIALHVHPDLGDGDGEEHRPPR